MIFKILFRAIFFYFMIIFAYKFMGKRELGELSLVDFVISTIMSQIIAISIENYKEPLLFTLSPLLLLVLLQVFLAYLSLKNKKVRTFLDGKESLIINKGKIIKEEMVKNIDSKLDCLLSSYRYLIDTIIEDLIGDKSKINDLNNKVISNATYVYLKEQEYFVINKYNDENFDTLNKLFDEFEKMVEENGIKKNPKMEFNLTRDFFLGFNNTIGVKIKNIFDEMNLVATMDGININKKLKEFNDLISHIYEINLNFDKQFSKYKKEYVLNSRNIDKFDSLYEEFKSKIIENIKVSISNIFRENIKIYNDIIYKSFGLKTKIDDFSYVLSEDKVKDLLLK